MNKEYFMIKIFEGKKRVLICPLGWGLGHATRMIPIVDYLLEKGLEVVVAGDEHVKPVFLNRYQNLEFIHFPSLHVKFSRWRNQLIPLIRIAFRVFNATQREHRELQKLIAHHNIDLVISDNRYGLYSKKIDSVFITHQLNILFPEPFGWFGFLGRWYVRQHANRFTECWIPDNIEGIRISGALSCSAKIPRNAKLIGLLSRFASLKTSTTDEKHWDLVVIASGPSPQREIFIEKSILLAQKHNLKTLILCGNPKGMEENFVNENILLLSSLSDEEMLEAVQSAKYLICRSGYSSIMDLIAMGKRALLVPTPGQTEQEYLARYLKKIGLFTSCNQSQLLDVGLAELSNNQLEPLNVSFFPLNK